MFGFKENGCKEEVYSKKEVEENFIGIGKILYENGTDTKLRDNIKNYKFIEIYYSAYYCGKNRKGFEKIFSNNLETFYCAVGGNALTTEDDVTKLQGARATMTFSGTSFTYDTYGTHEISGNGFATNTNNNIAIQLVIGYK